MQWPALRNYIPCMAHSIQLTLDTFMSSISVEGCTKSWEAHEHDLQFGENQSIDIGKCQRLREESDARINKVFTMRPGLAKIIEKVCNSKNFELPETDHPVVWDHDSMNNSDTSRSKRVH